MGIEGMIEAVENSDLAMIHGMEETLRHHDDPWQVHLSLYPVVQRVLNPPFINPHLPKMYHICRELIPYLSKEGVRSLVYLELMEYARRPKLEQPPSTPIPNSQITFPDVEKAIAGRDREETWVLLTAFLRQQGGHELVRRLMLLGSGYLKESLGHSVSCTAFILREAMGRSDIDAGPALFLLADYFCKGGFQRTPALDKGRAGSSLVEHLPRAVAGSGFTDLHHSITIYATERMVSFVTEDEHLHMIHSWLEFLGQKQTPMRSFAQGGKIGEYAQFLELLSGPDAGRIVDRTEGMLISSKERARLSNFLVAGVCDLYQGNYDPHYLTGLGSLLWIMHAFPDEPVLVQNALFQYLDFFCKNVRAKG